MSLPRRLLRDQTHAISRRCAGRCFFLVPDAWTKQLIGYCFAVANERYPSVLVHVLVSMSNHLELVATDAHPEGKQSKVPRFFAYAHSLIAKALNHRLGRGENLWAPGSYRNTEIHDEGALRDRLVYALANPAAANLVETLEDWPGLRYGPESWGQAFTFERPEGAFFGGRRERQPSPDRDVARTQREEQRRRYAEELREARQALRDAGRTKKEVQQAAARRRKLREALEKKSRERDRRRLPASATLRIVTPPLYAGLPEAKAIEEIQAHLRVREAEHRAAREREGKTVLGPEGVLAVDRLASAGSTEADYSLTPVVACKDEEKRKQVLKCLVGWRLRYKQVREAWPKERKAFPFGTYLMAVAHGAKVMSEKKALADGLIAHPTGPPGLA